MTKVRMVQITFANGLKLVGLVPATLSDEELQSVMANSIDVVFSDASEVPREAPLGAVLARITAVSLVPEMMH